MLVLSRKNQESVVVGNADGSESLVKVTVIEIRGGRVKLGFEAADGVPIHRSEIGKPSHSDSQSKNRLQSRDVAANEAMDRWDDDGGGAGIPTGDTATPPAAIGLASDP